MSVNKETYWKIKWMKNSNGPDKWDGEEIIEGRKQGAHVRYWDYLEKPYYYVGLFEVKDGKEQNIAGSCKSEHAQPKQEEIQ